MTNPRYSKTEGINRILRLLGDGTDPSSNAPGALPGDVYSEEEAVSRLAELIAGELGGSTLEVPSSMLSAQVATLAETVLGTSNSKFVSPYTREWVQQYGEIYVATGTVSIAVTADVWNKVTGSFTGFANMGHLIYVQDYPFSDKITVANTYGVFLVDYDLSFIGSSDVSYEAAVHVGGTYVPQTTSVTKPYVSGSSVNLSGHGYVYISGTSTDVDIRIRPSAGGFFLLKAGQLTVDRRTAT